MKEDGNFAQRHSLLTAVAAFLVIAGFFFLFSLVADRPATRIGRALFSAGTGAFGAALTHIVIERTKGYWADKWSWIMAALGVLAIVLSLVASRPAVTGSDGLPVEAVSPAVSTMTSSSAPVVAAGTISTEAPSTSASPMPTTASASPPSSSRLATAPIPTPTLQPVYLSDMDRDQFIHQPQWASVTRGVETINNQMYAHSMGYSWGNCGGCKDYVEFKVPVGYSEFTAVFGLSDNTRHDNTINGIGYFQVTCSDGRELFPSTKVEYPNSVPVALDITGCARLAIHLSDGDNFETFVFGDAELLPS